MTIDRTSLDNFIQYYRETFVPAYSDATGYILAKPEEILLGIENTFSHIAQYLDTKNDDKVRTENLKKAYHHLERATLDCYKIAWVNMQKTLEEIVEDQELRKFCVNKSESDFLNGYEEYLHLIKEARVYELNNVGKDITGSVSRYKEAMKRGDSLCSLIDMVKIMDYKRTKDTLKKKVQLRDIGINILCGLIGAGIGAGLTILAEYLKPI